MSKLPRLLNEKRFLLPTLSLFALALTSGTIVLAQGEKFQVESSAVINIGKPPLCSYNSGGPVDNETPCAFPATGWISQGPYVQAPSHGNNPAVDIASNDGLDGTVAITAAHDGVLSKLQGSDADERGLFLTVTSSKYQTLYYHLQKSCRGSGPVFRGQLIGLMDTTGRADGPHLHYEIRKADGTKVLLQEFNSLVPPYEVGKQVTNPFDKTVSIPGACPPPGEIIG